MGITLNQLTSSVNKVMTKIKENYVLKEKNKILSSNDYTNKDKDIVSKIVTNGDGTKFLSNDGTYKEFNSEPIGVDGQPIKEYGVRWDKSSSPTLTRLGDAIGLEAKAGTTDDVDTVVPNDFDNIYPWSGRKQCNLSANGEVLAYKGEPDFKADGTNGNVMVETPKFYQKYVETDEYIEYWISNGKLDGYRLSPRFIKKDGTELDRIYTGAYEASEGGSETILASKSGVKYKTEMTMPEARTYAKNIGSGWGLVDIAYRCDILTFLFLIEFATLNTQSILNGYFTSSYPPSYLNTGTTDIVKSSSGVENVNVGINTKPACIYRGEENPWSNIQEFIDGVNIKNDTIYVCSNPEDYECDKFETPYNELSYKLPKIDSSTREYIKFLGYDKNNPYCMIPKELNTGTNAEHLTYFCDQLEYINEEKNNIVLTGDLGAAGDGLFFISTACDSSSSTSVYAYSRYGARLSYKPI